VAQQDELKEKLKTLGEKRDKLKEFL